MADILMTATEVARRLNVNMYTVYSLMQKAHLPAIKIGHQWRFDAADITQWLHAKRQMTSTANPLRDKPCAIPEETHVYE